jgi:hypothetical protein
MFFIPVFAFFSPLRMTPNSRDWTLLAVCVLFSLLIGFRYEVGGDWFVYSDYFQSAKSSSLLNQLSQRDPAYEFLVWLAASYNLGISSVNFICAIFVMIGVYHFCKSQPQPWLALSIAVPYFLIVVAMGYTRQSVALGFELLALLALGDGRLRRFFILISCAIIFHKTAVVLLPLGILVSTRRPLLVLAALIAMSILLSFVILLEQYGALINTYSGMPSEGGAIRIAMNVIPGALFLIFSKHFAPIRLERILWTWVVILSFFCVLIFPFAPAAADRLSLYFIPVQIFVYSRIGFIFRRSYNYSAVVMVIITGYGITQWVLLNKSTNVSIFWLPYNNFLFPW